MKTFKKMQQGKFGLDDMLAQMHQMKKLGPLSWNLKNDSRYAKYA